MHRQIGNRSGEADALNSLGEALLATGQPDHARAECAAALGLAAQVDDMYQQARAHHILGQAWRADGDLAGARRHWQQALALFTELGTPEAEQVRTQLAAADDALALKIPPRTCLRSIRAVISTVRPDPRSGGSGCRRWCGRYPL